MAAILVSGGTYSGSGDVTCDYFAGTGTSHKVWLPDGTLTCTSEGSALAELIQQLEILVLPQIIGSTKMVLLN